MQKDQNYRKKENAKHEIESYGLTRDLAIRRGPWIFVFVVSIISIVLALVSDRLPYGLHNTQVWTLAIALGAFILGYQQWREARNEISMDRYYDRLELADRRLDSWPSARALVNHLWPTVTDQASYECSMYVYVEIDNLEYVIEKYKLGYMSASLALRGLRAFQSRCVSSQFRKLALQYVQGAGYDSTTMEVVKRVCRDFDVPNQAFDKEARLAFQGESSATVEPETVQNMKDLRKDRTNCT
jgi:hypothetical protein